MGRRRLSALADTLGDFARQCGYNVGVGHLTGALAAEMTDGVYVGMFFSSHYDDMAAAFQSALA